ncbi:unnamed protein product [Meloidogyne enterolobii]|uniref:Uncharacterized protein n=1 Tax=Meloidogyne enterolobii TaxID=390850 RepID=A0ACB0XX10_MELEN
MFVFYFLSFPLSIFSIHSPKSFRHYFKYIGQKIFFLFFSYSSSLTFPHLKYFFPHFNVLLLCG